jgi:site-specific DNA-methyltransferase (adenine-specific)
MRGENVIGPLPRDLREFDVFVRDHQAVAILKKILTRKMPMVSEGLTGVEPFKWASNFADYLAEPKRGFLPVYYAQHGKRGIGWVNRGQVEKNQHLIDSWKVLIPKAYGAGVTSPHPILGKPILAPSPSVCTGTFIFFHFASETEAKSFKTYYATKFFRFLVSLRKITQDAVRGTFAWVPQQSWDRDWTDQALYKLYDLTPEQIHYIESVTKPMELKSENE